MRRNRDKLKNNGDDSLGGCFGLLLGTLVAGAVSAVAYGLHLFLVLIGLWFYNLVVKKCCKKSACERFIRKLDFWPSKIVGCVMYFGTGLLTHYFPWNDSPVFFQYFWESQ